MWKSNSNLRFYINPVTNYFTISCDLTIESSEIFSSNGSKIITGKSNLKVVKLNNTDWKKDFISFGLILITTSNKSA